MPYIASSWPTSLLSRVRRYPPLGPHRLCVQSESFRQVLCLPGLSCTLRESWCSLPLPLPQRGVGPCSLHQMQEFLLEHLQEHHLSCHPSCTIHGLRVQNPSHGQCHCGDRIHDDHPFLSCVLLCHLHVVHLCHLCGPRLEQAFRACQCHRRDGHHDACRPSHVPDDRFSACEPHAWALPLSLLQPSQGA